MKSAKKYDIEEPIIGQQTERGRPEALSEVKLTPRSELGSARVATKSRKSLKKKGGFKDLPSAEAYIAELEGEMARMNDQLRAAHDENRELSAKQRQILRQAESAYVRLADIFENV